MNNELIAVLAKAVEHNIPTLSEFVYNVAVVSELVKLKKPSAVDGFGLSWMLPIMQEMMLKYDADIPVSALLQEATEGFIE